MQFAMIKGIPKPFMRVFKLPFFFFFILLAGSMRDQEELPDPESLCFGGGSQHRP